MGWREGVLVFRDMPLSEAVAEINRYRPGRIMVLDDALAAAGQRAFPDRPAGPGDRPDPRGLRRACAPAAQGHRVIELTQKIHENQFGFRAGKHDRRYRRRAARVTPGARHPVPNLSPFPCPATSALPPASATAPSPASSGRAARRWRPRWPRSRSSARAPPMPSPPRSAAAGSRPRARRRPTRRSRAACPTGNRRWAAGRRAPVAGRARAAAALGGQPGAHRRVDRRAAGGAARGRDAAPATGGAAPDGLAEGGLRWTPIP